ncbi:hypothetical protein V202x_41720 [Gimesia aquarii]|uniref:Uncharacterized protein n=1 Tax=Gimesia aquarii TaxID=2527964 RepID=A0A517WZT0_9PLAN|nr:hypothetical protein V202x_41720 [Gimesia aquarii]
MPNSNPVCSSPQTYHCDCESGGTSYPVPNTLQLDYYITNGTDTTTGTVTLKNDYETPCDWFEQIVFVCGEYPGIKTHIFGFDLAYNSALSDPYCGWSVQINYQSYNTPNATPGPCDMGLLASYSPISYWNGPNSCQCSPVQLEFYEQFDETTYFRITISE